MALVQPFYSLFHTFHLLAFLNTALHGENYYPANTFLFFSFFLLSPLRILLSVLTFVFPRQTVLKLFFRWYSVAAKTEKSPNFVHRLGTELRPNVYSIVAEEHQSKKRRKYENILSLLFLLR